MVNTQKIIENAQFLKDVADKMKWLLDNNVITEKEHTEILERLCEPYK